MPSLFPIIWEAMPMLGIAEVFAHEGGWDEAMLVAVPLSLFGGLVWLAIHRSEDR